MRKYGVAVVLLLAVFCVPAMAADDPEKGSQEVKLVGTVSAAAEDDDHRVIAVEIMASGNNGPEYYLVYDDAKGNELLSLVGKRVKVAGVVDEDEDDNKTLTVKEYSPL